MRRAGPIAALLIVALGLSLPARAGVRPTGAQVPSGRSVDLDAFAHLVSLRYDVAFRSVIAADLDRDGDQDVISATIVAARGERIARRG